MSDLRERAKALIKRMRDSGESYEMLAVWFAAEFATIRAEAKAEGWENGVEAMRELAGYVAIHACLVPPDGGAPTEEEREMCAEVARQIYEAGVPLKPTGREGTRRLP